MAKKFTLWISICLLTLIGLAPVASMFIKSLSVDGTLSLKNYEMLFQSRREWLLLSNSLRLASATTFLTVLLGVPLGILFAKTDLPFRRLFTILFVIPLVIPPYILATAWFYFLGRDGYMARILGGPAGNDTSRFLFGFGGTLLVMVSTLLPVVILLTMTYLRMINPRLEEAAKLSARWSYILRKISIPVISPGIFLSGLLVFILAIGEFGVPSSLRFDVFPVESFIQFSAFYNFNAATAAAIPLGLMTLMILIIERLFLRKKTFQLRLSREPMIIIPLRKSKPIFLSAVSMLTFIFVNVPIGILLIKSFSLQAYVGAFMQSTDSIIRSLLYASTGATCITLLGFFLAYLIDRKPLRFSFAADSMAIYLFALPGTVIGIGLISLWNTKVTNIVYASTAIILLGYIAKYTALSERIMAAGLSQVPHSMEEAAQIVGAGWFRSLAVILIPLTKRGLVAAWLVGFIFCLRDLDITMIIYPPAHDTLPVRIFTLMANSPEELIAALCVIMVAITLLPLGALALIARYRG